MAVLTFEKLLQNLKEKKYQPIYFLHGPESYFIDYIINYLESNVLTDSEKSFNMQILYGKDLDALTLRNAASRYPLMSNYQLIIIKEAQNYKDLAQLESYFEKPVPTTILVFAYKYKSLDKRLKFTKLIENSATVFESKKLDEKKIPQWIQHYVSEKNSKISTKAIALLTEYIGAELELMSNTLDKILLALPDNSTITDKEVEIHAGISRDYNVFELTKSLSIKNYARIALLINYFSSHTKEQPFPLIIGALYSFFSKVAAIEIGKKIDKDTLSSYGIGSWQMADYTNALKAFKGKTKEILLLIQEYDLRFKGVNDIGTPEKELVKELLTKISLL